jgi:hypothetical protein
LTKQNLITNILRNIKKMLKIFQNMCAIVAKDYILHIKFVMHHIHILNSSLIL